MIKSTNSSISMETGPLLAGSVLVGRVVQSFLDVASCDKAQVLFDKNPAHNVFRSVSVPQKQFPALVRFRELQGITHLKDAENKDARVAQKRGLIKRLKADNPTNSPRIGVSARSSPASKQQLFSCPNHFSKPFC